MGLFLGIFFGIFPFFSSIANGFMLGFAGNMSVAKEGIFSLWRIFPHGIFELPAIFISFGLGLKLPTFIFYKKKWETFKKFLENSFTTYLFVVIPLLIVAAIIEGTLIFLGV
jgi:stage II sporulation protein M